MNYISTKIKQFFLFITKSKKRLALAISLLIIIFIVIFGSIVFMNYNSNPNKIIIYNYSYSFAPIENTKTISNQVKDQLTKNLKDAGLPKSGVTFYGYHAEIKSDGKLYVDGFFRNNSGKEIYNIKGDINILQGKKEIASAYYELNLDQFGKLKNLDNRPWTLVYNVNQIKEKSLSLNTYSTSLNVKYDFD